MTPLELPEHPLGQKAPPLGHVSGAEGGGGGGGGGAGRTHAVSVGEAQVGLRARMEETQQ